MEIINTVYENFGMTYYIKNQYVEINDWTFVHFLTGVLLSYFFSSKIRNNYFIVFILHTLFEVTEEQLYLVLRKRVLGETLTNKVWDTIAFMLGYYIHYNYFKSDNRHLKT